MGGSRFLLERWKRVRGERGERDDEGEYDGVFNFL